METDDGRSRQIRLEGGGGRGAETVRRLARRIVSGRGDALEQAIGHQPRRCGTGRDRNDKNSIGRNVGSRIWSRERYRQPSDVVIVVGVLERYPIMG
jgi:hypothetical protein